MGLKPFFFFFQYNCPRGTLLYSKCHPKLQILFATDYFMQFLNMYILVELGFLYLYEEFPMVAQSIAQCRVMAANLNTCRTRDIGE